MESQLENAAAHITREILSVARDAARAILAEADDHPTITVTPELIRARDEALMSLMASDNPGIVSRGLREMAFLNRERLHIQKMELDFAITTTKLVVDRLGVQLLRQAQASPQPARLAAAKSDEAAADDAKILPLRDTVETTRAGSNAKAVA